MENNIYSYKRFDGRIIDQSAMLEYQTKEQVAHVVAVWQREHNLIAAIEAFKNAGELDLACQVLHGPRYAGLFR